jgi:tRNA pseudouridine38-40 synthase
LLNAILTLLSYSLDYTLVKTLLLKKYVAILSYDGTAYHGWQAQNKVLSIEMTLKNCFKKTFGLPVHSLIAASRTDAGVHAQGQVISFKYSIDKDPDSIKKIINDKLPSDIHFVTIKYAQDDFHPWYNVRTKEYWYFFSLTRPIPQHSRFVAYVRGAVNIEKLQLALNLFIGTHNFTAFSTQEGKANALDKRVKTIDSIDIFYDHIVNAWSIRVRGQSFLRHMIRRIVGAALFVSQNELRSLDLIVRSLKYKRREAEFPTAASNGLMLKAIYYDKGL